MREARIDSGWCARAGLASSSALTLSLATFSVHAQPTVPPPSAPASDVARYSDANSDRVLIFPTGETHPKGTLYFSDYDVIGLQLGYALTDHLQVELGLLVPFLIDAAVKLNFVRTDWVRVAALSAVDVPTLDLGPPVFRAGVTGQLCFSEQCWSSLSLSGMAGAGRTDLLPKRYGFAGSAGGVFALSRVVKILVEPILTWVPGDSKVSSFQWGAGLRIARERWGLDLGFEYIPGPTEFIPIVPLLSFTLRTLGEPP